MVFERFVWLILTLIHHIAQWGYLAIKHNFLLMIIFVVLLIGLIKVYRKLLEIENRLLTFESDVNRRTQTEKSKEVEDGKERQDSLNSLTSGL
jgi:hypothetical protein